VSIVHEKLSPLTILQEVKKPPEAFGFSQADDDYTLLSFGQMADRFKTQHFRRPGHVSCDWPGFRSVQLFGYMQSVSCADVEKEYWRLLSCSSKDISVEYGADLLSDDVGSGFPKSQTATKLNEEGEVIDTKRKLHTACL